MVSTMTLGFALMKFQHPVFILAFICYAVFVFVNVVYIGTHTVADVVVGWTFGAAMLAWFHQAERVVRLCYPSLRHPECKSSCAGFRCCSPPTLGPRHHLNVHTDAHLFCWWGSLFFVAESRCMQLPTGISPCDDPAR